MNPLFQGQDLIVLQFDGNNNDPDDISALPTAAALINAAGLENKTSLFYNNNLSEKNLDARLLKMRQAAGFAEKLGINTYDYQNNTQASVDRLVEIFNSGQKVLSIEMGPMEAVYRALERTSPQNLQNITLLSHSTWNENRNKITIPGVTQARTWGDLKRDFPQVTFVDIQDQNGAGDSGFRSDRWNWLDSSNDPVLLEMRTIMNTAGTTKRNDASDAGAVFYALTGNESGDPNDVKNFFAYSPPSFTSTSTNPPSTTATSGNDRLVGDARDNYLDGLAGNDTLIGGSGNDTLTGGTGTDDLDGGVGIDTADYSYSNLGINANLSNSSAQFVNGISEQIKNFENLVGTRGNDTLTGNIGANILSGKAGSDRIDGLDGNDTLIGGSGNDTLSGGTGVDDLDGGVGIDTADYSYSNLGINANLANSSARFTNGISEQIKNFENLVGTQGNDTLTGNIGANILTGVAGNDVLIGGAGADRFVFNSPANGIDRIQDFNSSQGDRIQINSSFGATSTNQFSFNSANGALLFGQQQIATLENVSSFNVATDIILV